MRIDQDSGLFRLSDNEVAAAIKTVKPVFNALATFPDVQMPSDGITTFENEFNKLNKSERESITKYITSLSSPVQTARIQYSISDELISRMILAWNQSNSSTVTVFGKASNDKTLGESSVEEFKTLICQTLAIDPTLKSFNLNIKLSSNAVIVMLAIIDYFRKTRFQSMLTHSAPLSAFMAQDISKIISDATKEDFRWALNFTEKLLASSLIDVAPMNAVVTALNELCNDGLLILNEGDTKGKSPDIYLPSATGNIIIHCALREISKLAIQVSEADSNDSTSSETMLFIRDSQYLWLFDFSGNAGWIASLTKVNFDKIFDDIFYPAKKAIIPASKQALFCSNCGEPYAKNAKFCGHCGHKI